ncbi:SRPBCC domain-containing protein [Candidatus Micrarchaeota archaeon]|nr:SRPBCC domain-containing protein [Candidatus Micrarchaeota archaeon]
MKTKSIRQTVLINASPHAVYEALVDSRQHAKFTGSPAKMTRKVGGPFSAYEDGLVGTNLELIPDKKIVQSWMCVMDHWPEDHYSRAVFSLKKVTGGTKLTFTQSGVPSECHASISQGWHDHYWEPLKTYFK